MIDDYLRAAIIGYWRSGATHEAIMPVTGIPYWKIEKVILEYEKTLTKEKIKQPL